ncbi:MaoC/PaaZ C-terminal domain-containing protein [uncultured Paraglaciecola sp.]|uniref:MaoC/PaaZ C-terminal domain-containing protein n=1 Tax=uncultured Paraglaciecola sp. TaxID=1765024 RepID=UPI00261467A1|nr:MaoC/PaaZ C-terminal domain-containing protein [uncultured Paraglaciecola sp.]
MEISDLDTTKLASIPNIKGLLIKAAFKQFSKTPHISSEVILPNTRFDVEDIKLETSRCQGFHQVVGWGGESNIVHPCYLHSLVFPLHLKLLLSKNFPFPLLGLVHISNQIRQLRPIKKDETLSVSSCVGELELHSKGWLFSIEVAFYSGSELVWQSVSTNLFRTKHGQEVKSRNKSLADEFVDPTIVNWDLKSNLGRRYAKVSGDYNLIHLNKWLAKLFGFKQHIIHGMCTKSYCISALQQLNPILFSQAFEINTNFRQPVYLPNQVSFAVQTAQVEQTDNRVAFKVLNVPVMNKQPILHLEGYVQTI